MGCVVVGAWDDADDGDDLTAERRMIRVLCHASTVIMRAAPLETGYARDVHGTMLLDRDAVSPPRPIFFRATDSSVTLFNTVL